MKERKEEEKKERKKERKEIWMCAGKDKINVN
jgi:hypothetical protein